MKKKRIGLLYSGGVDSAALLAELSRQGHEIWPIYIQCGLRWEPAECHWARKFLSRLSRKNVHPLVKLKMPLEGAYKNHWPLKGKTPGSGSPDSAVFLPARNLLLITKALLFLTPRNIHTIHMGTLNGNPFQDAEPSYVKQLSQILSLSFNRKIDILMPYRSVAKPEILRRHRKVPLHLSFSCINPQGKFHCGRCNKCAERKKSFRMAKITDKTRYS